MIFLSNTLNEKKFLSILNNKKNVILDFGCGVGVWDYKILHPKISKVFLYDKNPRVMSIAKKNYKKNKNISFIKKNVFFNKRNFFIKNKVNIIFFNSVIQYLSPYEVKHIILMLKKCVKKNNFKIIITDVPIYNRYIEFFLLFFFDFQRFLDAIKLIFDMDYYMTNFYKNNLDINFLKKNFKVKIFDNLNFFKFRKSILLKKKFNS